MSPVVAVQFVSAVLITISCTWAVHVVITPPQYLHRDSATSQDLLCNQCPPGTYVKSHCTAQRKTECAFCPDEHYAEFWNFEEECQYCDVLCKELQYVKQECNSTHKRICVCIEGYHLDLEFCSEHTKCSPGFGVGAPGTPQSDTVCVRCPGGFFSNKSSATDACQKHTNCTDLGFELAVKGNATHDNICSEKTTSPKDPSDNSQKCKIDESLCEEAVYRFVVPKELAADQLDALMSSLPGRKLNKKDIERITQNYKFHEQIFQLLKLWKHQNEDQAVVKDIMQGINLCKKAVLQHVGFKNLTLENVNMLMESLPGKKVGKEEVEGLMKICNSRQQVLQLLSLWRLQNGDQDTLKGITQRIKHLKQLLPKTLFRGLRKFIRFLHSSAMYSIYQKVLFEVTRGSQCKQLI